MRFAEPGYLPFTGKFFFLIFRIVARRNCTLARLAGRDLGADC